MAKKQVPAKRNKNQTSPHTPKSSLTKPRKSTTIDTKNRNKNRTKATKAAIVDVASTDSQSKAKDLVVGKEKKKPKIKEEKKKPKSKEKKKPNPQAEMHGAKSKGVKKRSKKEADNVVQSDEEEKAGDALYAFPMTRVSRIIKSDNPDIRVSQEAVFLINRASEMFLQVFCKEVYACSFLKGGSNAAYNHLSSVVAKRKRFGFLSDFVPEKVKAADALAQASEAEK